MNFYLYASPSSSYAILSPSHFLFFRSENFLCFRLRISVYCYLLWFLCLCGIEAESEILYLGKMDRVDEPHMNPAKTTSSEQRLTIDDAKDYLKSFRDLFHDEKEKFHEFLKVMKDFKSKRIDACGVVARVQDLLKEHHELIAGFNSFLPNGYKIRVYEEKESEKLQKARDFVEKIRARFKDDDLTYESFLGILTMYKEKIKSTCEVYREVSLILENHKDLFMEFLHFVPGYSTSNAQNTSTSKPYARRSKLSTRMRTMGSPMKALTSPSVEKMEDKEMNRKHGRNHKNGSLDRDEERESKRINQGSPIVFEDATNNKACLSSNKEEDNSFKPISELDLSNCKRCTPSYRFLPKKYRRPAASKRTEVDPCVLNDKWVSVAYGSEDYSSNHTMKNQYEEILFKCEEDRFELDMLIESIKSTTERVETLLEKLKDKITESKYSFCIEDHLTFQNLRCIERLYDDHGLEVMDVLSKNPSVALPVILSRLKQKTEEWCRCRADFNKVWSEISAKNHNK